ncbi:MAG: hypothetical protein ACREFQ_05090 [Stellaceae bacterium]
MRAGILVTSLAALLAFPALAQAPQGTPTNVRGTILKLSGDMLALKSRDGSTVDVTLASKTRVSALVRKKLSDIKDGDYIASTSMPGKDGKLHALEVHFLPSFVPELQAPWDLRKGSVMTNAHVSGIVKAKNGEDISLIFKGKPTAIVVGPRTVIVGSTEASMADLKPGKAVFLRAIKQPDGKLVANNATVEKNGVKPPM